mgnify:FL=1
MLNKIKYRFNFLKSIFPYTKGVRRFFIFNAFLSLILTALSFINPLFYKIFIEDVIINSQFNKIIIVIIGYIGVFLLNTLIGYLNCYFNFKLVKTVLYKVKLKMWQGFFKFPFEQYDSIDIGDLKMKLEDDATQIEQFASNQTIDYVLSCIKFVVCLIIIFAIDWRLALFSIIIIPITFYLDNFLSKRENKLNDKNRINDQNMTSWLHSSVRGWREVKALTLNASQNKQFVRYLHNYALHFGKWINYWTARVLIIPRLKDEFFMQFGLYFIGGLLVLHGDLRIGNLLIFTMYYDMFVSSVRAVSSTDSELKANMPYTDRLISELNKKHEIDIKEGIIPDNSNTISLSNISFTYPNSETEIFHDFSLKINKGEKVAITGRSGRGKTTLLKLITGMLKPTSGDVSFSGVNLQDIDVVTMYKRIGFVMQENMLFNTTIRENLFYGKENARDDEIWDACKKAYISDFIKSFPQGLDTVIGERGIKLSGGQRQRIVLARLFLRDVDVFIFDEATSALDQYSENIIQDVIYNISKDKTVIVVSHRESSIALCERKIEI